MIPLRDANPVRQTPVVTIGLIVACALAFLIELTVQLKGDPALERFFDRWALVPAQLTAAFAGTDQTAQVRELATVLSSMFLHGGWIHLGGNMLYLWIFGNNIEDRFGRLRFLAFYLLAGIAAAATQVLRDPASASPIIGASGAIAGVLGAYLVLYPRARVLSLVFLGFFYQLLQVPAVLVLGLWFVLQLLSGLMSLGPSATDGGVALFAHIGGFLFGVAVGLVVRSLGPSGDGRRRESLDEFRVG
jgi:membrane associated rhomboid family serine protease